MRTGPSVEPALENARNKRFNRATRSPSDHAKTPAETCAHCTAEHGISDADALHVFRSPFRLIEQEDDYEGHLLIIGVDLGARLLEVGVIAADDPRRIIHVNLLQPKNYDYL